MVSLFETNEFLRSIEKLEKRDVTIIQKKLTTYIYPQIKKEPHVGINIKKLIDYKPETWRYRIGKFRVLYAINEEDKIILLLVIIQRKDAY